MKKRKGLLICIAMVVVLIAIIICILPEKNTEGMSVMYIESNLFVQE